MDAAFSLACWKSCLTLEAPTPTKTSTKSEPETEKKGTPASPAHALASMVLPVPGGPVSSTPLGMVAPRLLYFSGCLRKSTTSCTSLLLSCSPATSSNLMLTFLMISNFFCCTPMLGAPPMPDPLGALMMVPSMNMMKMRSMKL